jgi:hypothetical protein
VRHRRLLVLTAIMMLLVPPVLAAEVTGWQQKVGFELLFNEGYYSSNWQGDEKTSGSVTATLGHRAAKQFATSMRFEHELGLAFGQQAQPADSPATGLAFSKSEDKIRLDDLLRFTLGAWVDPLVAFKLKSQFVDGAATPTRYFNPIELMETGGAGRRFYDDSTRTLTSQLGFSARQLFNRNDTVTVADAGVSWTTQFRTVVFSRDAEYTTRLVAYKPLLKFGGGAGVGTWPQLDWEHALSARFNKALSGKVYVQILFDETVNDRPRLKQTLGMGLSLAWPSGA